MKPPAPFDFSSTAFSHGWVVLPPNAWDPVDKVVHRVQGLDRGEVVVMEISGKGTINDPRIHMKVHSSRKLATEQRVEINNAVSSMFRLEEDLSEFYRLCKKKGRHWLKLTGGMGRLLASPTVFEDLIKTICTTNIQWGGTKRMVAGLVECLGLSFAENKSLKTFPTPETIAAQSPDAFSETMGLGYRGPYIHELAQRVAGGDLNLEAFRDQSIPTTELRSELMAIKGIGAYAAAVMLTLLGRYDYIAADTVFRDFVSQHYFEGQSPEPAAVQSIYEDWGTWKALAYWFEMWMESQDEAL